MENHGNVICSAKFKTNTIAIIIMILLVFLIPFILFTFFNHTKMDNEYSVLPDYVDDLSITQGLFTITMEPVNYDPNHKEYFYYLTKYDGFEKKGDKVTKYYFFGTSNKASKALSITYIILIAGLGLCVAVLPIIKSKRCSLELTEGEVRGQLKTIFGKKKLQMPIDHIDSVMTASTLMDKLRGGNTLLVTSNRGLIKFHYVQNADEFAQAAMKLIDEAKKKAPSAPQSAPVQNVTGGDAMEKINSLKQMLDSGLISQEEFDQKKADILSKM